MSVEEVRDRVLSLMNGDLESSKSRGNDTAQLEKKIESTRKRFEYIISNKNQTFSPTDYPPLPEGPIIIPSVFTK